MAPGRGELLDYRPLTSKLDFASIDFFERLGFLTVPSKAPLVGNNRQAGSLFNLRALALVYSQAPWQRRFREALSVSNLRLVLVPLVVAVSG